MKIIYTISLSYDISNTLFGIIFVIMKLSNNIYSKLTSGKGFQCHSNHSQQLNAQVFLGTNPIVLSCSTKKPGVSPKNWGGGGFCCCCCCFVLVCVCGGGGEGGREGARSCFKGHSYVQFIHKFGSLDNKWCA